MGDTAAVSHPVSARVTSLGLAVQPGEGGWRITWDPNTPAARDSVQGALNVSEVDTHERIPLNAGQIRAGTASYRPVSDDITFRLELLRPDNSLSTETYRVLLKASETAAIAPPEAKKSAMPAPAPAPAKPETPTDESYVEPEVVSRVSPEVPDGIRPRITAPQPIDVRVSIDREGRVTSATPLQRSEGLVNYLGQRAVAAARQWTFTPAKRGGKPVSSSRTIHFVFEQ
jgi:TonB family protein